jgi:hypothetical protein
MATPGQLSRTVARLLGLSEPTVLVHDRNLAAAGLRTTTGGRGRSAAKMTPSDAAALLITAVASPSLRDSVETFQNYSGLFAQKGRLEILSNNEVVAKEALGTAWDLRFLPVPSLKNLSNDHTLIQFLTAVIAAAVSGELKLAVHQDQNIYRQYVNFDGPVPDVRVTLHVPFPSAEVQISTEHFKEHKVYFPIRSRGTPIGIIRATRDSREDDHQAGDATPQRTKAIKAPNTDLRADYTFSDRTIYSISKLIRGDS